MAVDDNVSENSLLYVCRMLPFLQLQLVFLGILILFRREGNFTMKKLGFVI